MKRTFTLFTLLLTILAVNAQTLEQGFINPPQEAKPRVWWHWLNANITDEGIKADLNWMNRVGIGGFHNFDANQNSPQIVKDRLVYMTPKWKTTFQQMTHMADSLGMEMAIAASPGWSETGGPWVSEAHAMKKVVWSETDVRGGRKFQGKLPQPPAVAGLFQQIGNSEGVESNFYREIAVLAIKLPDAEKSLAELAPKVTTSGGNLNLAQLTDGDFQQSQQLICDNDENGWILYEFAKPQTFYAISQAGGGSLGSFGSAEPEDYANLEYSNDGINFTKITGIHNSAKVNATVLAFAPVTAKYFRLYFASKPNPYAAYLSQVTEITPEMEELARTYGVSLNQSDGPKTIEVAEFNLHTSPRIHHFIEKAGYSITEDLTLFDNPKIDKSLAIHSEEIVDLTAMMGADGTLEWTPAQGRWRILRFGYSLTGKQNSPASPEATGLEVDKFEPAYVSEYLNTYLNMYKEATGGLIGKKGITHIMLDSWEAGTQNWTDKMPQYFKELRGYDLMHYLPTLAGYVVDDTETSDRFLWDFRKTIGELITNHHYGTIDKVLAQWGLKRYTESHESQRAYPGDGMEPKKHADIPMAATWTPTDGTVTGTTKEYTADVRESASVAHIYGQKIVAAESLTAMGFGNPGSAWAWAPETLKPTADLELSNGLNRFVLHSTVHQPDDDHMPGLSLGIFGHWFNRHETWAEQAGPWMTYLARSSYMMQQGKPVEDILYFYGEDTSLTTLFKYGQPEMPAGYSYDFVNADALENVIDFQNGRITTPAGTEYSLLVLDKNAARMTLKTLRKIDQLVRKGMTVLGDKPVMTPSLVDDTAAFQALADALWTDASQGHKVGNGTVYSGRSIASVLAALGNLPDCQFRGATSDAEMHFVHRKTDGTHIYWINSRNYGAQDVQVSFKIKGMKPELWDAVTGNIRDISYTTEGENTIIPLHFNEFDAYFIVFREPTTALSSTIPAQNTTKLADLSSGWQAIFDGFGCHKTVEFPTLTAWNEHSDSGIKYYSGSAIYRKKVSISASEMLQGQIWLDLGNVKNIAEVSVNGQPVGELWRAPFRIELSRYLKPGDNELEVKVTNLWVNRLIGDQQPDAEKYTFTAMPFYNAKSPLKESGLIGPVSLELVK